jgi:hypothetical protein
MKKTSHNKPVNRCFADNSPPQNPKKREEQIKDLLTEQQRRKRAERELASMLKQFAGKKSLLQLLPAIQRRCSKDALLLAVERIERKKDDLSIDDRIYFEGFKTTITQG